MTRAIKNSEARITCEITRCATRVQVQVLRGLNSDANLQDYALAKLHVCRDRDRVEIHTHLHDTQL